MRNVDEAQSRTGTPISTGGGEARAWEGGRGRLRRETQRPTRTQGVSDSEGYPVRRVTVTKWPTRTRAVVNIKHTVGTSCGSVSLRCGPPARALTTPQSASVQSTPQSTRRGAVYIARRVLHSRVVSRRLVISVVRYRRLADSISVL